MRNPQGVPDTLLTVPPGEVAVPLCPSQQLAALGHGDGVAAGRTCLACSEPVLPGLSALRSPAFRICFAGNWAVPQMYNPNRMPVLCARCCLAVRSDSGAFGRVLRWVEHCPSRP